MLRTDKITIAIDVQAQLCRRLLLATVFWRSTRDPFDTLRPNFHTTVDLNLSLMYIAASDAGTVPERIDRYLQEREQ